MEPTIVIGASHSFVLREALLLYESQGKSFVTRHNITIDDSKQPQLGPAQALTRDFLKTIYRELHSTSAVEILPSNVLACTDSLLAWWIPAQRHHMFFNDADRKMTPLSGRIFPHPTLVFAATERALYVRALSLSKRPDAATPLFVAPYWNTYRRGNVCLGSMRIPENVSVQSIAAWETSFFESAFTHPSDVAKLTNCKGGFVEMWNSLAGSTAPFPCRYLVNAEQTLSEFLNSIDD